MRDATVMPSVSEIVPWHAGVTWFMTGIIWFVQLVHYPLMGKVGPERWKEYEVEHQRRTTWIVAPAMLIEAATAIAIPILMFSGTTRGTDASAVQLVKWWFAAALLAISWISTFAVQVPLHARLAKGFECRTHLLLVNANWVRTAAWSARAVLVSTLAF